jgi:glycosyltransferase involved in cell wall biosynthesis
MKSSVIITADHKERQIERAVNSCLNQSYKNIEIILVYSSLKNILQLKTIYKNKVKLIKVNKKLKNPLHDQIYKIREGFKNANGKNIYLLDGDDYFKSNKIELINIFFKKKKIILLNDYIVKRNSKLIYYKKKNYKDNFLYKKFFNSWPDKICTSSIVISYDLLNSFFKKYVISSNNYIAIDVLLILFFFKRKFKFYNKILTIKDNSYSGIDKNFNYIFSKNYWFRRKEQHNFFYDYNKKNFSLDELLCKIIFLIISISAKINSLFLKCIDKIIKRF